MKLHREWNKVILLYIILCRMQQSFSQLFLSCSHIHYHTIYWLKTVTTCHIFERTPTNQSPNQPIKAHRKISFAVIFSFPLQELVLLETLWSLRTYHVIVAGNTNAWQPTTWKQQFSIPLRWMFIVSCYMY